MSCSKWKTDIALYVGADLPANRLARAVAHLEACAECRALAGDLRAGQTLLAELRDEPLVDEDEMAANVRRSVLANLPMQQGGATPRYWTWALAAALIVAMMLSLPRRPAKQAPVAHRQPATPQVVEAPAAVVNVRRPVVRRHRRARRQPGEPLLVQLVTDDPNIVIYWLVDPKPQGD